MRLELSPKSARTEIVNGRLMVSVAFAAQKTVAGAPEQLEIVISEADAERLVPMLYAALADRFVANRIAEGSSVEWELEIEW